MKYFLHAKHYEVFLILLGSILILQVLPYLGADIVVNIVIRLLAQLVWFVWIVSVGQGLNQYLPPRMQLSTTFFSINVAIVFLFYAIIIVFSEGQDPINLRGWAAIGGVYFLYAVLQINNFPARVIKTIELRKRVEIGESIGTFFIILLWPVGIWFLQPRINKIVEGDVERNSDPTVLDENLN